MPRVILVVVIIVAVSLGVWFAQSKPTLEKVEHPHVHAGFHLYRENELMDFSDLVYMHLESCRESEAEPVDEQVEKAHLHNGVGDVVHVHRQQVVWGDLFINLKQSIRTEHTGYVNGVLTEDILNYPINAYDSVVIIEGEAENLEEKLAGAVKRERILEVEAQVENCGS
jgi:hypothetical protein